MTTSVEGLQNLLYKKIGCSNEMSIKEQPSFLLNIEAISKSMLWSPCFTFAQAS